MLDSKRNVPSYVETRRISGRQPNLHIQLVCVSGLQRRFRIFEAEHISNQMQTASYENIDFLIIVRNLANVI